MGYNIVCLNMKYVHRTVFVITGIVILPLTAFVYYAYPWWEKYSEKL